MDLPLLKIKLYSVLLKHGYTKVCISQKHIYISEDHQTLPCGLHSGGLYTNCSLHLEKVTPKTTGLQLPVSISTQWQMEKWSECKKNIFSQLSEF